MSGEITQLLKLWSDGDANALDQLMPLIYDELKKLARHHLRKHGDNLTLQPTAVVNEAYLRLMNQGQVNLHCRAQFFGLAAKIIRELLIDDAKRRHRDKRGGGTPRVSMTGVEPVSYPPEIDLLALDEALNKLAANKPQHSRIVELRFFGGMTIAETAEVVGISTATVERDWNFARAWLFNELAVE
ncbi:MAG: sigma-70 family RNA polymerase sigma factor [Acidobacteria bacterium]|nr:sigma-70 family RNA polymerase sigma factor [Acidobacteriota bacterium]